LPAKRIGPATSRTLPAHTPLSVLVPVVVVVIVGALIFVPALTLRPAVEHLQLVGK